MYEDPVLFRSELSAFFASSGQPYALDRWRLIEVRYPEQLADWLTNHPDYCPPQEQGIRIGKRLDHFQGGRRNT